MKIQLTLKQFSILAVVLIQSFVATAQSYNNIEFIENKGQWDSRVKFMGDVTGGAFFIRTGGFTVLQHNREDYDKLQSMFHGHQDKDAGVSAKSRGGEGEDGQMLIRSHAYNVDFVGASKGIQLIPDKPAPGYNNYFMGDDPSKWAGDCRIFQAITLKDVYPNIDVRYYTDNGTLKYDIIAQPGADISKIALRYEGAEKLSVKNKELIIGTSIGELKEAYPYTYQADGKERRQVNCKYVVKDNIVRFDVKGYDPKAILVIDPSPVFCSFSGSAANNWGFTATYGPDGSFFGGGIVFSNGFPVLPGAFQTTYQLGNSGEHPGAVDMGIIKLSPDGSTRVYATYLGGSGNDQPHSLIVDPQGNLIVAGRSSSPLEGQGAYPVTGGAAGIIRPCGGHDIVVTKLNLNGTGLIGSKRVGGTGNDGVNITTSSSGATSLHHNYGDGSRSEVIIDGGGNIYVASCTQSANFPASANAFQRTFGGGTQDGVVLKFTPDLSSMTFASFLGGRRNDAAYVLSISPATGDIYVAGGTESDTLKKGTLTPHTGTLGNMSHGGIDGFVARISNDGTNFISSVFVGTNAYDQVYGIQFDRTGFPYIMGQTTGAWAPINATYVDANAKQFIGKLQPDLSAYVYTTTFGTSSGLPNISPIAFLVDRCENVYVSGWGGDVASAGAFPNAGTTGLRITPDALQPTTDGRDFYFFVMRKNAVGPNPLYASFFGQNGGSVGDHVDGGTSRFDANGVIYQGVCANCGGGATFPTTFGSFARTKPASAFCNLGMVKQAFNLAGVGSDVSSSIGGMPFDTAGCVPLTVVFTDQVRNALQYIWNFGDGTGDFGPMDQDTGYTRTHTYNNVGTYRVMLVAIDPNSCNVRDTSYVNIRVGDLRANLAASYRKLEPCDSFNYRFYNNSTTVPARPFTDSSFRWVFDDGTPPIIAGLDSIKHTFASPGTYFVRLELIDTAYCNYPDEVILQVSVAINVEAGFTTNPVGCAPYAATFDNTSNGGLTYEWNFGDPASGANNTSTDFEPTHMYAVPGTYTITMIATNLNTCNVVDTAAPVTIIVYGKPTADFTYTPVVPVENTPVIFNNLSSPDAVSFKWVFGDGDSLLTTSRNPVEHQYNATGTFTACLYAYNSIGCDSVVCKPVSTLIVPALDVPNAFTPNQPGINSVVTVRGFGITKMRFIIWNRWGQKVFETNNRSQGWNGRVKGAVQPMDVYAYTLEVEFFDGTKASKKGDITLIR